MSIFDLVKAPELTSYWEEHIKDMPPYLGEELFPAEKKLGLKLDWIKGAKGLPVVLKPSAFDTGMDSPVRAVISTSALPLVIMPSR